VNPDQWREIECGPARKTFEYLCFVRSTINGNTHTELKYSESIANSTRKKLFNFCSDPGRMSGILNPRVSSWLPDRGASGHCATSSAFIIVHDRKCSLAAPLLNMRDEPVPCHAERCQLGQQCFGWLAETPLIVRHDINHRRYLLPGFAKKTTTCRRV